MILLIYPLFSAASLNKLEEVLYFAFPRIALEDYKLLQCCLLKNQFQNIENRKFRE
jgi:hypothetical protein